MIANFSVNPRDIKETTLILYNIDNTSSEKFPLLCIGRDSYIVSSTIESGINMNKDGVHNIQIGKFCSIAHNVAFVVDLNHNYLNLAMGDSDLFDSEILTQAKRKGQIMIQNDVWIGRGSTIMSGVTIGNGAVIAANSHVVKDVPPYAIVGGNPAKVIKFRFEHEIIENLIMIQWWNWREEKIKKYRFLFKDINSFCDKFCNEAYEEKINIRNISIPKLRDNYLFFADFDEPYPIWIKVILEFCDNFKDNDQCQLIVYIEESDRKNEQIESIEELVNNIDAGCGIYIQLDEKVNQRAIFKQVDYFITNRSKDTILRCDYANENKVKIISGVDMPIF